MSQASPERLETLYRVSQAIGSTLDLDSVLNAVIDQVVGVTRAERGFLMLGDVSSGLDFRVARGIDQKTIEAPEFEVSRGVVERVAQSGKAVMTSDAQSEDWLAERTSVMSLRLRSIMCVPLLVQGRGIGLVYVDNRVQAGIFGNDDLELLQAVANTAAVAIENARLHIAAVEQARLERELEVARQVQTSLMPLKPPDIVGFELAGLWRAAREVGGDFYDFIPRPDGQWGIVIGDVTDKGVPAAFFMALARTTLRASLAGGVAALAGLEQANRLISADSSSGMFVTLLYAGLDPDSSVLSTINAGHMPPLHYRASAKDIVLLPRGGLPLGVEREGRFAEGRAELRKGDAVLLYTDGLVDAIDHRGNFYGWDRLKRSVISSGGMGAADMLASIERDVDRFSAGTPPFDDLTMVVVKCVGR
jgi:sigma-B regulation protein RsbU (phosphoserine phosphatase)